jgi:hypothetical protein
MLARRSRAARRIAPGVVRNLARWFTHEYLTLALRGGTAAWLQGLCRLAAWTATAALLYALLRGHMAGPAWSTVLECLTAALLAVAAGLLVQEIAYAAVTALRNWSGRDFTRTGLLRDGGSFHETHHADWSWERWQLRPSGTVYEWTDPEGRYHRVASGPDRG